jgi:hypothetical protein
VRRARHAAARAVWAGALSLWLVAGCAAPIQVAAPTPAPGPAEAARHRAALANVTVENRTAHALTISFRPATPPGGPVGIGSVAPGARVTLAPVPAGEPIVLIARRADRSWLELEPRSFEIDETWHWVVPASATFRTQDER